MMKRFLGVATVLVMLGVGSVVAPAAAHADPACASVSVTGTATGSHEVGPYCIATPRPVLCVRRWAGFEPHVLVTAEVCVPV